MNDEDRRNRYGDGRELERSLRVMGMESAADVVRGMLEVMADNESYGGFVMYRHWRDEFDRLNAERDT